MHNIDKKYPQLLVKCGSSARNILKFTSATFGICNQENPRLLRKIEIKLVSNLQMALLKSRRTIFSLNQLYESLRSIKIMKPFKSAFLE